jgi:hypothetical protein
LIDDGLIEKGSVPSYFIEGLLYNVPDEQFEGFSEYFELAVRCQGSHTVRVRERAVLLNER